MIAHCSIEVCLAGNWQVAANLVLQGEPLSGHEATAVRFSYELDYGFAHLGQVNAAAVSLRFPVDLADHRLPNWPPFLLDLLPTGAGRRRLCQILGLPDGPSADWELLRRAGGPPPGNLRIQTDRPTTVRSSHSGFARREVVERAEGFIQHCIETGYPVGGSSAVQGESPKVLLSEDTRGRFHPSGTLAEDRVKREWLVKFPRGRTDIDRQILKAEATYYDVARRLGCRTGAPLQWEADCLFVPRFDVRPQMDRLQRSGLETMASAMGKTGFGQPAALDEFVTAIRRFSSVPGDDILELFRRDVLNVALGNTDNHSRNTSFLKDEESVRLAPLYDFAPMMVDPEWIARACRWQCQEIGGYPCWRDVIGAIAADSVEKTRFRAEGKRLAAMLPLVPEWLRDAGIGKPILERCEERCCRVMKDLINADQN